MTEEFQLCEWGHCLGKLHRCSEMSGSWRVVIGPTEYHDTVYQTITEPPPCFTVGTRPGIPNCRLSWVFSKRKLFLMWRTTWRMTHPTISCTRFQLSDAQVLWWWHHVHIYALLSVIKCLAIAALLWMLDMWSSCQTVFVETVFKIIIQFCCRLCCSTVIFQKNPFQCRMISFCQYWFSLTVPLCWCLAKICICWHNLRNSHTQYT
jgi:hypothetical protein